MKADRVQKLVTEDSFVNGVLVPAGQIASYDPELLNGNEPHIHDVPDIPLAVVEMAPIGPTGPNPVMPQQISPDTVQGPGGGYFRPGARIVGEVTRNADQRLADRTAPDSTAEGDINDKLRELEEETAQRRAKLLRDAGVADAEADAAARAIGAGALAARSISTTETAQPAGRNSVLIEGSVKAVTADLGAKTDDQLSEMLAAEKNQSAPRKGVLDAVKAEQDKRKSA